MGSDTIMKKSKVVLSQLCCDVCNFEMTIPRKANKQKTKGHIKHMYCPSCQVVQPFIEGGRKDSSIMFWEEWQAQFE